ncbi:MULTISPECIES: cache domain-containing protein [Sorangium]|uniref:cache domain-containing protein n=1 Tax=Sorangium TaxID=39643 RepID=UPI0013EA1F02|nr:MULTISPECIES: cache domain-containing protein [Sorangium]
MLVPLALALAVLLALYVATTYSVFASRRDEALRQDTERTTELLRRALIDNVEILSSLMSAIERDPVLEDAMLQGDREALLERGAPLLQALKARAGITHLYFHAPDRVNFLRVHEPPRFGDTISRVTLLEAEQTGQPSFGNEQGPLGTYTLRYVVPWRSGGRLLGYIELGKEFEHVAASLRDVPGVELVILVDKRYVQRELWEPTAQKQRLPLWDTLPSVVSVFSTVQAIPDELSALLSRQGLALDEPTATIRADGRVLQCMLLPIDDVRALETAKLLVMRDVTSIAAAARMQLAAGCAAFAGVSAVLLAMFHVLLGRIQRALRERSTLLNSAKERLEQEIEERKVAQKELEAALSTSAAASQAKTESLAQREEALRELRAAKLDLEQQLQTIERQRITIRELSLPIVDVWDEILALSIIGPVDAARATEMMEGLLRRIVEAQARWIILDVTGLPAIDEEVAARLARVARAVRLLGCACIVTGISPHIARTFVALGVELDDLRPLRSLKEGIKHCMSARQAASLRSPAL